MPDMTTEEAVSCLRFIEPPHPDCLSGKEWEALRTVLSALKHRTVVLRELAAACDKCHGKGVYTVGLCVGEDEYGNPICEEYEERACSVCGKIAAVLKE